MVTGPKGTVRAGGAYLCGPGGTVCHNRMMLFLDSWILPFIFLASIGMAILYNLGSNFMLGEISYVTKALARCFSWQ